MSIFCPQGKDRHGVSNMAKLAYIEYGVRSKNRAPKPIILKAIKDATPEAEKVMQKKIEELTQ